MFGETFSFKNLFTDAYYQIKKAYKVLGQSNESGLVYRPEYFYPVSKIVSGMFFWSVNYIKGFSN